MPRTLITGGAGFVGSHLCDALLGRGHRVICLDNLITGRTANIDHLAGRDDFFAFIKHDVTEVHLPRPMRSTTSSTSPRPPARSITWEYPIQTLKVGALGSHKALGLARAKGARFLLAFGTSEVYGDPSCTRSRRPTGGT